MSTEVFNDGNGVTLTRYAGPCGAGARYQLDAGTFMRRDMTPADVRDLAQGLLEAVPAPAGRRPKERR